MHRSSRFTFSSSKMPVLRMKREWFLVSSTSVSPPVLNDARSTYHACAMRLLRYAMNKADAGAWGVARVRDGI